MRILICGAGSIGERHLRNLLTLGYGEIAVYRTRNLPFRTLERVFPVYTDLDQALADYRPDVAFVTNPTALHMDTGLRCAQAGCHRRDAQGHTAAGLDLAQDPIALREHLLSGRRGGLDALLWVEVGRPESSYLLRKLLAAQPDTFVRSTGSPMPLAQPPLSTDALRTIETWIRTGAQ